MHIEKILITGANGMLGQKLVDLFQDKPTYNVLFTSNGASRLNPDYDVNYQSLDITDRQSVLKIVSDFKPDAIINCAAFTHVDRCEDQIEACEALNVNSVGYFIDAIGDNTIKFIHISTDFVFDGEQDEPYTEEMMVNPLSQYGLSKKKSEDLLLASSVDYLILRTSFVYGVLYDNSRSNFVLWSKSSLENNQSINVISDQFRAPTLAEDLAFASFQAINSEEKGIYHIVGPETFSILGLVNQVADFWSLDKSLISPILTKDLNQKAQRPLHTNLSIDKAKKDFDYTPMSFSESLSIIDKQLNRKQ